MVCSKIYFRVVLELLLIVTLINSAYSKVEPTSLKCELKTNPIGISETKPRLSWILTSSDRNQVQSGYKILVSSTKENLDNDFGDLWDTGDVWTNETHSIIYNGKALLSGQKCFWKVKCYDKDKSVSKWSPSAFWSVGLLNKKDWNAKWIGFDKIGFSENVINNDYLNDVKWIWYPGDSLAAPICKRYFKKDFYINDTFNITTSQLIVTADDKFKVFINGRLSAITNNGYSWNILLVNNVIVFLQKGKNEILIEGENLDVGFSGVIAKLSYGNLSDTNYIKTDSSWLSTADTVSSIINWLPAKVLGDYGMKPWNRIEKCYNILKMPLAIYMRKTFQLPKGKAIKNATLYSTSKGINKIYINGMPINNDIFSPGITNYRSRIFYQTNQVDSLLTDSTNTISAILAEGWFSGYYGPGKARELFGTYRRLLVQINIEYFDGTKDTIYSDSTWKVSQGPIRNADLLMGEFYNSLLEKKGWTNNDFDDSNWYYANSDTLDSLSILAHPADPIRVIKAYKPLNIKDINANKYIFDLGQNITGFAKLKLKNEYRGEQITIRYSEMLDEDGTLYLKNLGNARSTDEYICKGDSIEEWAPLFSSHGFRYIEVSGLNNKPDLETVTGIAISSDNEKSFNFECSNDLIYKIYKSIYQTQLMNFIDIPTDCQSRDERLGWTGDAQLFSRSASLNNNVLSFYEKWLGDLNQQQLPSGEYPQYSPHPNISESGPGWADAGIICPWTMYDVYGEKKSIELYYDRMKKFIDYRLTLCNNDLTPKAGFFNFGDWYSLDSNNFNNVIFMAYTAHDADLMSKYAKLLNKVNDYDKYQNLFQSICESFKKNYVLDDGRIKGNSQTYYALTISFDMVSDSLKAIMGNYLIYLIESHGHRMFTGYIGTRELFLALSKLNRNDVAYKLIVQDKYSSLGHMIVSGATTIWERWDGWRQETGFADPGGNSFAHLPFGAASQWIVENIAGVRNTSSSYNTIDIKPFQTDSVSNVKYSFKSVNGVINSELNTNYDSIILKVSIPVNTTARVFYPTSEPDSVTESGNYIKSIPDIRYLGYEKPYAIYSVGSGDYVFSHNTTTIKEEPNQSNYLIKNYLVNKELLIENLGNIKNIFIYDLTGKEILKLNIDSNSLNIDFSIYKSGIYILKLLDKKDNEIIEKIVKVQ